MEMAIIGDFLFLYILIFIFGIFKESLKIIWKCQNNYLSLYYQKIIKMARKYDSKQINYLKIDSKGLLYKKGQQGQQGVVEVEITGGKRTYREYFNGGTELGKITFLGVVEKNYPTGRVEEFIIRVEGQDEIDSIQIPFKTAKGGLNGYVKNLACFLPNVDYTRDISVKPGTKLNKNGYAYPSIYFNYEDRTTPELAHKFGEDIPDPIVEQKMGKTIYNFSDQDDYLYNILMKEIERFKEHIGVVKEVPVEDSQTITPPSEEEIDDLPF